MKFQRGRAALQGLPSLSLSRRYASRARRRETGRSPTGVKRRRASGQDPAFRCYTACGEYGILEARADYSAAARGGNREETV